MDPTALCTWRSLFTQFRSDLRRSFKVLLAYEILFKLLSAVLLAPMMVALLFHLVRLQGRTALTNTDILGFLVSPLGVCYAFLMGLKIIGVGLLEHAGAMSLAAMKQTGHWLGLRHALVVLAMRTTAVLFLAGKMLLLLACSLAPWVVLAAITYGWLLSGQDINYYLSQRPPEFYQACFLGALLTLTAAGILAWLYVRWAFALPILLFENASAVIALHASAERTQGIRWRLLTILLGVVLVGGGLHLLILGMFKLLAGWFLSSTGRNPSLLIGEVVALLLLKALFLALVSSLTILAQSLLLLRLYVERSVQLGILDRAHWTDSLDQEPARPGRLIFCLEWGIACVLLGFCCLYLLTTFPFHLREQVQLTAHRGYSLVAPENTLAAIQAAKEAGVDWVEIDVQLTSDGQVVLLHDGDLMRMCGDPRPLSRVSLAELRTLPLLPRFGSPPQHIPTLREVIEWARGKVKLNIELKFTSKDRSLAEKVAELLRELNFEDECFVASLHVDGVLKAREHNPRLRTAAIITAAVGDFTQLDVDILSVHVKLATDDLLRRAHRLGKEIHVWTVNDPRLMRRFIESGVHNIITDDLAMANEIKTERESLSDAQRLLLTYRYLLE